MRDTARYPGLPAQAVFLTVFLTVCLIEFGRVRDFEVIDKVALGVEFCWEKDGQPISSVVFERNSPVPSVKLLTFFRCCSNLFFHAPPS